jgi:hypothetical protein
MTQALILHPTAATVVPVTHVFTKRPAKRKVAGLTVADYRQLLGATSLKVTSAHSKAELAEMLRTGKQVRPAAYDRNNAARKAKRAAAKL